MLKQLLKDSFVYGLSNVVSRGIALFLLPLYTRVFSPTDYGIIDILNIVATLVNLTVALEISQGVARYYADSGSESDRVTYVSTALWFSMFMYGLFVVAALWFSEPLSHLVLDSNSSQTVFQIAVLSMWSTGIFYFLQQQLRWQLLPWYYAVASILFTLVSAGIAIVLILVFDSGVVGVFYGLLVGGGHWRCSCLVLCQTELQAHLQPAQMQGIAELFEPSCAVQYRSLCVSLYRPIRDQGTDDVGRCRIIRRWL